MRGDFLAFSQMFSVAQMIKKMYEEYGIHYIINPSYNLDRSDHELYERGITQIKDIKWTEHHFETQSECYIGKFLIECAKGYYFIIHGKKSLCKIAPLYFQHKCDEYREIIGSELATRWL